MITSCSAKKQQKNNETGIPFPTNSCEYSALARDYEKLRQRMWEMKHHVCLLEFGLGSVATLIQDFNDSDSHQHLKRSNNKDNSETCSDKQLNENKDNARYKQVLHGIGEVLEDVESSMKAASDCPTIFRKTQLAGSGQYSRITGIPQETATSQSSQSSQVKMLVDEQQQVTIGASENSLTETHASDLCNIEVVENNAMFSPTSAHSFYHYNHQQSPLILQKCVNFNGNISYNHHKYNKHYEESFTNSTMPSSFDDLSTLASVAASQHTKETKTQTKKLGKGRKTWEKRKSARNDKIAATISVEPTAPIGQQTVNPVVFIRDEDRVPLKKRRHVTTTTQLLD